MSHSADTHLNFTGRTAWARNLAAPVRAFLSTETVGAAALVGATVAALIWANAPGWHSYETVWATRLSLHLGSAVVSASLRQWINQGLMTLFFLVVGLEARRELEAGELRERDRLVIPAAAAACGMLLPILIFLSFNAGGSGAHGWGCCDVIRHRLRTGCSGAGGAAHRDAPAGLPGDGISL